MDDCPHKGGPLSQGIVHGVAVTCPLHNRAISLETGKALGASANCGSCRSEIGTIIDAGRVQAAE